jgi:hypothetical protein
MRTASVYVAAINQKINAKYIKLSSWQTFAIRGPLKELQHLFQFENALAKNLHAVKTTASAIAQD